MEAKSVNEVFRRLNDAGVRYLVAGGLAVVAHGHVRFTKDIDLALALDPENVRRAIEVFRELGYRPMVAAVLLEELADAKQRRHWIEDKNAKVLSLFSNDHRMTPIDVFVDEPFDFEEAYARALRQEYSSSVTVAFVGRADLIEMKRKAGRPQDLLDIESLERLQGP